MKIVSWIALIVLVVCGISGCGKKSALEGKVVDGKGKPLSGVKVVAKQVEPIKGYELFESKTGSDGSFKFGKLFPSSAYELITYPDGVTRDQSIKTESGPEGQTKMLPEPITVWFHQFSKDGVVATDTETGLTWARNANIAGREMNWFQAMVWVQGLDIGGLKGWRLPNKEELETLAKAGGVNPSGYFNSIGFSNVQAGYYWSSSTYQDDHNGAWVVNMGDGSVNGLGKAYLYYVWPVRSGQ
jgi:hypothetical protein